MAYSMHQSNEKLLNVLVKKTSKPIGKYTCIREDNIKIDLKIDNISGIRFT